MDGQTRQIHSAARSKLKKILNSTLINYERYKKYFISTCFKRHYKIKLFENMIK